MSKQIYNRFLLVADEVSRDLRNAIHAVGPVSLRKRRDASLPETLCRAVAGQQLSGKAAETIWGRVIDFVDGRPLTHSISRATVEQLRGCGLSGSKAKAMKAIVEADAEGILEETSLKRMKHIDRSQQLTSIWGVGQWTADMLGIFYFGDRDVWPDGDTTVRKTFQRLCGEITDHHAAANRFAPARSYLALYMYAVADARPDA